jgi:hypothetical protein
MELFGGDIVRINDRNTDIDYGIRQIRLLRKF